MQGFSAESQTSLDHLAGIVATEIAQSSFTKKAETKRARMAWYLGFCKQHKIDNPCGTDDCYASFRAIYAKALITGQNMVHRTIKAAMARLYLEAVNEL